MAIDFTKLNKDLKDITATPNLPEGYYQGKLIDYSIIPAKAATQTTAAKAEQLLLTFGIQFQSFNIAVQMRVANFRTTLKTKDGRDFEPIATVLNPIRAQANDLTLDLPKALEHAAKNPINLGYHRNDRNYLELKVVYPQTAPSEDAEEDTQLPADI